MQWNVDVRCQIPSRTFTTASPHLFLISPTHPKLAWLPAYEAKLLQLLRLHTKSLGIHSDIHHVLPPWQKASSSPLNILLQTSKSSLLHAKSFVSVVFHFLSGEIGCLQHLLASLHLRPCTTGTISVGIMMCTGAGSHSVMRKLTFASQFFQGSLAFITSKTESQSLNKCVGEHKEMCNDILWLSLLAVFSWMSSLQSTRWWSSDTFLKLQPLLHGHKIGFELH